MQFLLLGRERVAGFVDLEALDAAAARPPAEVTASGKSSACILNLLLGDRSVPRRVDVEQADVVPNVEGASTQLRKRIGNGVPRGILVRRLP